MNRYLKHIILALLLAYSVCFSQGKIDSLISRIEKANVDTVKAKLLTQLSWSYILTGNYDEALSTANKAFELSKNWKTGQAIATVDIAYVHIYRGELKEALNYFFKAYSLDSALGHKGEMAKELGGIGGVYSNMSDYPRSLRYYLEGLKLALALNDKVSVAKFQSNIGVVYVQQKDNLKALDYLTKAIKGFEETNNEIDRASAIGNKGIVYENLGQHAKAISCFKDALKTAEETGDKYRMTLWCENMGVALEGLGDSLILIKQATRIKNPMYEKAYGSYTKALDIAIETDDKMGMAIDNGFLGVLCTKYEKFKEAENFLLKARALADTSGSLELIAEQLKNLSNLYTQTGRAKQALEVYKQYILFKDSVFNEDNTKKQTQLEMQYEFDKKEAAARLEQEKKDAIANAESRKQKIIIVAVSSGLVLLLILAFVILRSLRLNQKKNRIISMQKEAVERQKEIVEEHQKEILDSIYYARRIQRALLPTEKYFEKKFRGLQKK